MTIGIRFVLIGIIFLVLVPLLATKMLIISGTSSFDVPLLKAGGAGLIVMGGATLLYCTVLLYSVKGTPFFTESAVSVQQGGLYRFTRNPMYLSDMLITLGVLLVAGAPPVLIIGGICVEFVYFMFMIIKVEEPRLRKKFGEEYEKYAQRVARWIPLG